MIHSDVLFPNLTRCKCWHREQLSELTGVQQKRQRLTAGFMQLTDAADFFSFGLEEDQVGTLFHTLMILNDSHAYHDPKEREKEMERERFSETFEPAFTGFDVVHSRRSADNSV